MSDQKQANFRLAYERLQQLDPTIIFNQNESKNLLKASAKSFLKLIAWPFLLRQVAFNTSTKELLEQLIKTLEELQSDFQNSATVSIAIGEQDRTIQRAFAEIRQRDQKFYEFKDKFEKIVQNIGAIHPFQQPISNHSQSRRTLQSLQHIFVLKALPDLHKPSSISILIAGNTGSELGIELANCGYQVMLSNIYPLLPLHSFECAIVLVEPATDFPSLHAALTQISACLRPGGRLILSLPGVLITPMPSWLEEFTVVQAHYLIYQEDNCWQIVYPPSTPATPPTLTMLHCTAKNL